MSVPQKDGNHQLERLPITPKNGGVRLLGKRFQDVVINFINSCRVTKVVCPMNDGTTNKGMVYADIKSTALGGTVITLPGGMFGGVSSGTTPGTTGGMIYRGVYAAGSYDSNDVVIVQSGVSAGTYISVIDANTNDPATGIGWMQLAPGNTVGFWT